MLSTDFTRRDVIVLDLFLLLIDVVVTVIRLPEVGSWTETNHDPLKSVVLVNEIGFLRLAPFSSPKKDASGYGDNSCQMIWFFFNEQKECADAQ